MAETSIDGRVELYENRAGEPGTGESAGTGRMKLEGTGEKRRIAPRGGACVQPLGDVDALGRLFFFSVRKKVREAKNRESS